MKKKLKKLFLLLAMLNFHSLFGETYVNFTINDSTLQTDGKLIVVGNVLHINANQLFVARYNTDGTIDTAFGTNGYVVTSVNESSSANSVKMQSDGKVLVAGYTTLNSVRSFLVARYTTAGVLDTTFGPSANGLVATSIGDSAFATDLVLQSDNKIVLSGTSVVSGITYFALARYLTDGTLDSAYGTSGTVLTLTQQLCHSNSMVIQTDNKVVIGGSKVINGNSQFVLARYTTAGVLDTTFNTTGVVTTNINNNDGINSLAIKSTGEIIAGGSSANNFALARYTTTGDLDTTFNGTGIVVTTGLNIAAINAIALGSSNNILVIGYSSSTVLTGGRYNDSGSLDGISILSNLYAKGSSISIQTDNKYIITGNLESGYVISRYNSSGILDTTYGNNGYIMQQSNYPYNCNSSTTGRIPLYDPVSNTLKQLVAGTSMSLSNADNCNISLSATGTIQSYGYFYTLTGAAVAGGAAVQLNVTGPALNMSLSSATITLTITGTYFACWRVSTSNTTASRWSLYKNGSASANQVTGGVYGAVSDNAIVGLAIFTASANDTITLRNATNNTSKTLSQSGSTPQTGSQAEAVASLVIIQI